ncbi:uncharacterized protein BDV14DRAFT_204483 [Aspergillus stella-maris]|uniref:uncharacterized protein n=1 Tax=Aspergillus stella-maris TaxID=1810926 RepID=UPI003CCD5F68
MVRLALLTTTTAALVAGTSAIPSLSKRDSGLKCESKRDCVSWYTTGGSCTSGYKATSYDAPGYPVGFYCERECNSNEREFCAANKCTFSHRECNLYPGNRICADAMTYCGTPVKMPKDDCDREQMGQPVKYDDAAGTCEIDFDADAREPEKLVRYNFGQSTLSTRLVMTCAPRTIAGVREVDNAMLKNIDLDDCDEIPADHIYTTNVQSEEKYRLES